MEKKSSKEIINNINNEEKYPIIKDINKMDNNDIDDVPLGFFIEYLFNSYGSFIKKHLNDVKLTQKQAYILLTLFHENSIPQEKLASLLNFNEVTVTREVNYLEKKNYIIRKTDENDKRKKIVSLSEKGYAMQSLLRKCDHESEIELLDYLNYEELHILKFLMRKVMLTLDEINEK